MHAIEKFKDLSRRQSSRLVPRAGKGACIYNSPNASAKPADGQQNLGDSGRVQKSVAVAFRLFYDLNRNLEYK